MRDRLNDWGYPLAISEIPCLLVSELVTNAIVHAGTHVGLALRLKGRRLRSVVSDESSRVPGPRGGGPRDDIGHGLQLVEELADDWGVETTATGKAVWFEVDLGAELSTGREGRPRDAHVPIQTSTSSSS
jgi:anti-sigma regulatory factor (Ser/Thr protein kinase)